MARVGTRGGGVALAQATAGLSAARPQHTRHMTFTHATCARAQCLATMKDSLALPLFVCGLLAMACSSSKDDATDVAGLSSKTVLDLDDVKTNPTDYDWFDFRPNVEKLILAGAAETEHVAILWYTVPDGAVGLHYHAKTESVYVVDGTQTDAKGTYPTGTVYFNPPGSGHQIMNSSGFMLLAYASPPDFAGTDLIQEYTPVRMNTADPELMTAYPFQLEQAATQIYDVPLDSGGGMSGKFLEITSADDEYAFEGNYVLVLEGSCAIEGVTLPAQTLVVAKTITPEQFRVTSAEGSSCLAMGVSF
jgi:hypothetical protein